MSIESDLATILANQKTIMAVQSAQGVQLNAIEAVVNEILSDIEGPAVVAITAIPGPVTTHSVKGRTMQAKSAKLFKKGTKMASVGAPPTTGAFSLVDNGDQTFTVGGVDQAGNPVTLDPAAVSITAVSDTPATLTVDPPSGLTFAVHVPSAPAPAVGATANVLITATWGDGSVGPFTFTCAFTITASATGGIVPTPGPVTTH